MTKNYFTTALALAFLFVTYKYSFKNKEVFADDELPVKVFSYRTLSGWGYEIEVDGKIFIHQDIIPAIQGNKSFHSSEDALKVGQFVLNKMKNNKKPVITVDELKRMKIKDM